MSDEISQAEFDGLTAGLQFSVEDSPDFQVVSRVLPEGLPLITITGRVLGVEAASLTDRICNRYAAVKGNVGVCGNKSVIDIGCEALSGYVCESVKVGTRRGAVKYGVVELLSECGGEALNECVIKCGGVASELI